MPSYRYYRFRLEPTAEQERLFYRYAGCRRYVWNWAYRRKRIVYSTTGKGISCRALCRELTNLKRQPEAEFLQECNAQVLQSVLIDLDQAFVNFFEKRSSYPRMKSRKRTPHAFRFPQDVRVEGKFVRLPKLGRVRVRLHRSMEGVIKTATVKQAPDGHWFISFVNALDSAEAPVSADKPTGIDLGLATFATLDSGRKIPPPRFYRKQEHRIRRAQRVLFRSRRGSRNRQKARRRLALVHAKVRSQRGDWLHKLSRHLVQVHDTICLENLNVKGLAKTKQGSKSWHDAAHGYFVRMLEYKGLWYGCQVVKVGRLFPSTKTCSGCGHQQSLLLSEREWTCGNCALVHDRDVNAAKNLLREGLRLLAGGQSDRLNACGEDVSPATAGDPHGSKNPCDVTEGECHYGSARRHLTRGDEEPDRAILARPAAPGKEQAMLTVPSARLVHLQDQRADALRLLADVGAKIGDAAAANEVLADAAREALQALQEAVERLSTWCPELFGPGAPSVVETCLCWRCSYQEPFDDPFDSFDEPG